MILPANSKRLIFIRPDSIGDTILSASLLPKIYHYLPGIEITVVCQNHIQPIYEACPYVHRIISFSADTLREDPEYLNQLLEILGQLDADVALSSVYSATLLTHALVYATGAKIRIGLKGDSQNISADHNALVEGFYTHLIQTKPGLEMDLYKEFLKSLGIQSGPLEPVIWLTSEDDEFASKIFVNLELNPQTTIALFATGQEAFRNAPHLGLAVKELAEKQGLSVLVLGGPDDYSVNEIARIGSGARSFNLSGQTSIRQSAAILKRCKMAVGVDTGAAHIAAALKVSHVVLVGGGHFGRFLPYSPVSSVVALPLNCFGCNWRCKYSRHHCMTDIRQSVLTSAVNDTWRDPPKKLRIYIQSGFSLDQPSFPEVSEKPLKELSASRPFDLVRVDLSNTDEESAPLSVRPRQNGLRTPDRQTIRIHIGHHFYGAGNVGEDLMIAGFIRRLKERKLEVSLTCCSQFSLLSQSKRFPEITWYDMSRKEELLSQSDIWLGLGGAAFQSDVGDWLFDHLACEVSLCQRWNKPVFFLGVGLNNPEAAAHPHLVHIMKGARRVWTRDDNSAEWLSALQPKKVELGADLSHLELRHLRFDPPEKDKTGIILVFDQLLQPDLSPLETRISKSSAEYRWLVQEVRKLPGSELELIKKLSVAASTPLTARIPNYELASSAEELIRCWGTPERLISNRYHATLIGAWMGARIVLVDRNMKIRNLQKELGVSVHSVRDALESQGSVVESLVLSNLAEAAVKSCDGFLDEIETLIDRR
jgi:ADP-heptose:LPS heptosyltransferase/polysaccharide pyruvyl transferase WcaK-like protein